MSAVYIPTATREFVSNRAKRQCEYCQTQERVMGMPLEIEHIIPTILGGNSDEGNLCLACPFCNRHKGIRIDAVDEQTGDNVSLFHPRQQDWHTHFYWEEGGLYLVGRTPTGRVTIATLQMNNPFVVRSRHIWIESGWHPPHN